MANQAEHSEGGERCFVCPTIVKVGCVTQCGHVECPFRLSPMQRAAVKQKLLSGGNTATVAAAPKLTLV